jgi:hypothetical protein
MLRFQAEPCVRTEYTAVSTRSRAVEQVAVAAEDVGRYVTEHMSVP